MVFAKVQGNIVPEIKIISQNLKVKILRLSRGIFLLKSHQIKLYDLYAFLYIISVKKIEAALTFYK